VRGSVFRYPTAPHARTETPPAYVDYTSFKPYLQREFRRKCVYCRRSDFFVGKEGFGVEHYRPKSLFPSHRCVYSNLFYACNRCNTAKGDHWPTRQKAKEAFIPNPCDHAMAGHLRYAGATVVAKSIPGAFALDLLHLNDKDFETIRETTIEAASALLMKIDILRKKRDEIDTAKTAKVAEIDLRLSQSTQTLTRLGWEA